MSRQVAVSMSFEEQDYEHRLVSRRDSQRRPGVILFPTVMGVSDLEIGFGSDLVHLGYTALVADVFGTSFRGAPREVMAEEMNRLKGDRSLLRRIVIAVLEQARTLS